MKKFFIFLALIAISKLSSAQETSKAQIDYFQLITTLNEYKVGISESFHLITSWVFIDKKTDTPAKIKLANFQEKGIPRLNEKMNLYGYLFDSLDLRILIDIRLNIDELVQRQKLIMQKLSNYAAYDDPLIVFDVIPLVEERGEIIVSTEKIMSEFDELIQKKTQEYIELLNRQSINLTASETPKIKQIRKLLDLLNAPDEVKLILSINNKGGMAKNYLEKDIYNILITKYDKYYSAPEIDDIIAFYKTKTGKRMVKVSKKMMAETLLEITNTLKDK